MAHLTILFKLLHKENDMLKWAIYYKSMFIQVILCDNLELPFCDDSFDAVLSLAVIHHFATTERRVSALRELARILRIGGRVIITVWALEQRHRRFESQDVLIPWQPPKNRPTVSFSDEEDDDDFLPPYNAYTEDSTNSSRSAGDGDSSSLSSSSPGESCYSFVRRAIQKLAGRKHPWFLDSWTSKDTKNDSSIDFEDAKDLPIELRRLEDFEDFTEPQLSAGLKSRSLGSILNPPPRQIVRSRSSVPSLGGPLLYSEQQLTNNYKTIQNAQYLLTSDGQTTNVPNGVSSTNLNGTSASVGVSVGLSTSSLSRRPKLIKQKQSLCDEDYQLPENPFHMISSYNNSNNSVNSSLYMHTPTNNSQTPIPGMDATLPKVSQNSNMFLRKQSSLNEELMAGNRIREKERVRKRIQKQTSLNEAFLCRSALFTKRLQIIREGFTSTFKHSTGSLERVTKNGLSKIMENIKAAHTATTTNTKTSDEHHAEPQSHSHCQYHQHQHHHHQMHRTQSQSQCRSNGGTYQNHFVSLLQKQLSQNNTKYTGGPVTYCNSADCVNTACYCSTYHQGCTHCLNAEDKSRRHSRESGSDSSKDSSLQSDTSVESEDSFASVIYIPKPEQHQQQLNYKQQHQNSNSSSSNSSSSNGGCQLYNNCCQLKAQGQLPQHCMGNCAQMNSHHHHHRMPSAPTSPLIMPCPPTPAHSPAAAQTTVTSPPQTMAAVLGAMAILTPPCKFNGTTVSAGSTATEVLKTIPQNCFNFDELHIKEQQKNLAKQEVPPTTQQPSELKQQIQKEDKPANQQQSLQTISTEPLKITRQLIKDLPPIPKFRKQQSLQISRPNFPILRRSSASGVAPSIPKLLSLELFNPATDDLDSDSSEASSPDSVDSVISMPKSTTTLSSVNEEQEHIVESKQQSGKTVELKINSSSTEDIIPNQNHHNQQTSLRPKSKQECAEFAEQLSAKLLLQCAEKTSRNEFITLDNITDVSEYVEESLSGGRQRNRSNSELRDVNALREELRERRLMLANLSTQPSQQQSPTSSSTSSLSSQTRSSFDEDNERSYMLQLYDNCKISKFHYKRNRHHTNLNPETAYLLQDDCDSLLRDEIDEIEHDVILEEDEEAEDCVDIPIMSANKPDADAETTKHEIDPVETAEEKTKDNTRCASKQQQTNETWEHSNSSNTSLDSPSQGGATTHHRYYHVFREGELDALINNHVTSLHIISSYYERASWCVVAEKVQVWSI